MENEDDIDILFNVIDEQYQDQVEQEVEAEIR